MSQQDIEPLREICYCLGISSLITRLDDVKLTISFQVTQGSTNCVILSENSVILLLF